MLSLSPNDLTTLSPVRSRVVLRRYALWAASTMLVMIAGLGCSPEKTAEDARPDTAAMTAPSPHSPSVPVDTQRVALNVKGMFCESCESTVTAMLRRTPGVLGTDVSVARSEAVVMYDSTRTSPSKLVDVIGKLGYTATPKGS